jgi:excisionase family DNA binding protein
MAKRTPPEPEGALYVRLPAQAVDKLDRASEALGVPKKELVAGLVTKYVDPDSRRGLSALGALTPPRRFAPPVGEGGATVGSYSFQPDDAPEVLTAAQAAELLQVDEQVVCSMAEAGTLPGRKLGKVWRFSRTALIAWLSSPASR